MVFDKEKIIVIKSGQYLERFFVKCNYDNIPITSLVNQKSHFILIINDIFLLCQITKDKLKTLWVHALEGKNIMLNNDILEKICVKENIDNIKCFYQRKGMNKILTSLGYCVINSNNNLMEKVF